MFGDYAFVTANKGGIYVTKYNPPADADLVIEGPLEVGSVYASLPFPPNHLNLIANIRNKSSINPSFDIAVTFYSGDPDMGGFAIETISIEELNPGESTTVIGDWWLNGNVEDQELFVQVTSTSTIDPNLDNNRVGRTLSVYYVPDFEHDDDAYSFANKDVGNIPFSEIDDWLAEIKAPVILQYPLSVYLSLILESQGYCYGISNTSAIYYSNNLLKPIPQLSTYSHSIEDARANIRSYQWYAIGGLTSSFKHSFSWTPEEQYAQTLESIMSGKPIIHGLMKFNGHIPNGAHAVLAYKIVDLGSEKRIYYYDNEYPVGENYPIDLPETYGVFTDSGFSYEYSSNGFNNAFPIKPQISSNDQLRLMMIQFAGQIINWLFTDETFFASTDGNIEVVAIDSQGRRTGYISGQIFNEIPGASLAQAYENLSIFLPTNESYEFQLSPKSTYGILSASDMSSFSLLDPITGKTAQHISFENIVLSSSETATIVFTHGQNDLIIDFSDGSISPPEVNQLIDINDYLFEQVFATHHKIIG